MKERPILFSAPMVRGLLNDTKTQTRRVFKAKNGGVWPNRNDLPGMRQILRNCPYGQRGDRLWVREAWRAPSSCDHLPPRSISDSEGVRFMAEEIFGADPGFGKGRPGMFMPRWASRITLEITEVRVERLQDISEADALAEGIVRLKEGFGLPDGSHFHATDPRQSYLSLWESINGPGSVEANPWVWAVSLKRMEGTTP